MSWSRSLSLVRPVSFSTPADLYPSVSAFLCPSPSVSLSLVTVFLPYFVFLLVYMSVSLSLGLCLLLFLVWFFFVFCFFVFFFCLLLGLALSQCVCLLVALIPLYPHTSRLSPQDPTNGYYKVQGVSMSLSLGEAPGGSLFLPAPSSLGPLGTPPFYDFNPHLGMPAPCRLYRAQAGYLTTPHSRAFTSYVKPMSFGTPDLAPGTPPFPYAAFPTSSHARLQTHV